MRAFSSFLDWEQFSREPEPFVGYPSLHAYSLVCFFFLISLIAHVEVRSILRFSYCGSTFSPPPSFFNCLFGVHIRCSLLPFLPYLLPFFINFSRRFCSIRRRHRTNRLSIFRQEAGYQSRCDLREGFEEERAALITAIQRLKGLLPLPLATVYLLTYFKPWLAICLHSFFGLFTDHATVHHKSSRSQTVSSSQCYGPLGSIAVSFQIQLWVRNMRDHGSTWYY